VEIRRAVRVIRLDGPERRLLVEAWLALILVRMGLLLCPFRTLRAWAEAGPPGRHRDGSPAPIRAATLVEAAARHHFIAASCLAKALVLCRLLRRRGYRAQLALGAARATGRLEAHAWVVCEGCPLTAAETIDRFEPLLDGKEQRAPRARAATPGG